MRVSLVTNQPVGQDLLDAVAAAKLNVPKNYERQWRFGDPDLHRLVHASGLSSDDFKRFAEVLDLKTSSGSRFEIEDDMLKAIAAWSDTEFVESAGAAPRIHSQTDDAGGGGRDHHAGASPASDWRVRWAIAVSLPLRDQSDRCTG